MPKKETAKKPELLAPAGDWSSLNTACQNGADAVYFGIKGFNMRHAASNFDSLELNKTMKRIKGYGKKGYLVINTIIYDSELKQAEKILTLAKKAGIDAVVLWDMALLELAKKIELNIHLSTQASVSNFMTVKKYASLGVKRIVLARECALKDIANIIDRIKKEKINCQIETFIHGAVCVSLSGRCFLSHHTFQQSANRGKCLQPCRRKYKIIDTEEKGKEYILGSDYILSAEDLCTIEFIDKLIEAGISAFKIEGRMRAPEYVKEVVSAYRNAVDLYYEGKLTGKIKKDLVKRLKKAYNRGFTKGFYFGQPKDTGAGRGTGDYDKIFVGEVKKYYKKIQVAEIAILNRGIKKGETILTYGKTSPANMTKISEMELEHKKISNAKKGEKIAAKLPFEVKKNDKVFFLGEKKI